jgi:deoxyribose-phosphate aldolase
MDEKEILSYVDHTQLKPFSSWADIQKLCEEAIRYQTASVCVPPCYVKRIHDRYGDRINICTVIGFPLGYSITEAKVVEAEKALYNGASEIDLVINMTDVKNKDYMAVQEEIVILKKVVGDNILKVIIETCYLTTEEKVQLCKIVTAAGADFIKTSTGFGTDGATLADIKLFKENIGKQVRIKAAGGVRSMEDMKDFISAGCSRIGTSSAVALLEGKQSSQY